MVQAFGQKIGIGRGRDEQAQVFVVGQYIRVGGEDELGSGIG